MRDNLDEVTVMSVVFGDTVNALNGLIDFEGEVKGAGKHCGKCSSPARLSLRASQCVCCVAAPVLQCSPVVTKPCLQRADRVGGDEAPNTIFIQIFK